MSAFIAFLTAFNEAATVIGKLWSLYRQAQLNGWVKDGRDLANKIDGAQTDEERKALAEALFNHRA